MVDTLFNLKGKTAIITGGMGQLGIEYSVALVERGVNVAILDTSLVPKKINSVFNSATESGKIKAYKVDITQKPEIESAIHEVENLLGAPDILINNAALDSPPDAPPEEVGPFEQYPESSFDKIINVNVKGTFFCCQVVGELMAKKESGSIINISSIYGIVSPRQDIYNFRRKNGEVFYKPITYSVSKSAIINMTRYLATYWAPKNVRVNTLTLAGVFNNQPREFLESYCKNVPLGRMANPDDYIGAVIFLSSPASNYMTGANLVIDGGWTAW